LKELKVSDEIRTQTDEGQVLFAVDNNNRFIDNDNDDGDEHKF
jgi:hypothetical protein